jgi:hypothetical protein
MPVTIPGSAAGTSTRNVVRQCGTPSASDDSRTPLGTRRSISSEVRATIGSISTARATPPAHAEKLPNGNTRMVKANKPITMEGMPVSTSSRKRTAVPSGLSPNCER